MDLTLPEIPGALLGYRRNGQPIYLAAGGDGRDDEDDNTDDQTEDGDDGSETDDDATDWKAKFEAQQKINKDLERRYKKEARTAARQPVAEEDDGEDDDDSPDARVRAAELRAIEAEVNAMVDKVAYRIGPDAVALVDTLTFRRKLDKLGDGPDAVVDLDEFAEKAEELIRAELKKAPKPKPTGPARKQGADVSGGAAGRERPKGIAAAISARYNGGK